VAPPILEYLAALTRRADPSIEIELISASADPNAFEKLECDLAAISILTPTAVPGYRIAEKLRARGIKIVFGNMLMACMTGRSVEQGGSGSSVQRRYSSFKRRGKTTIHLAA